MSCPRTCRCECHPLPDAGSPSARQSGPEYRRPVHESPRSSGSVVAGGLARRKTYLGLCAPQERAPRPPHPHQLHLASEKGFLPTRARPTPARPPGPRPGPAPTLSRSSCFMAEWMVVEGKLHSFSSRLSSRARATLFTKITTWGRGARGQGGRVGGWVCQWVRGRMSLCFCGWLGAGK